jgi:ubiquinone/menaquinone biosynthesis C-methylase UbiE
MSRTHAASPPGPHGKEPGALIRWPRRYDLLLAAGLAGRGGRLRTQIADTLGLVPGHHVLDVGCGTGTLAFALAGRIQPDGSVRGVDASPEMIAVATSKAARRTASARFQVAAAQALPFPDASFDAVVTSLMLHHLPQQDRLPAVEELLRVLKPGSTLVIVEFQAPGTPLRRRLTHHVLGHAMATNGLDAIRNLAATAGAEDLTSHSTPLHWLGIVAGRRPTATRPGPNGLLTGSRNPPTHRGVQIPTMHKPGPSVPGR